MKVYQKSKEQVLDEFKTNLIQGLSSEQVIMNHRRYGFNKGVPPATFSIIKTFFAQLCEPLIFLLAACCAIIFFTGDQFDAFIILGIIFLNATIGTFQERRITLMIEKLRFFKKRQSTVIRDSKQQVVLDEQLVPGDIIIIQEGNYIPADARIIESYDALVDESMLTGESEPVAKLNGPLNGELILSEQKNMLFCGSHMVSGYAHAVVIATGVHTVYRTLIPDIEVTSSTMPLQRDLTLVLKFILWLIVFICVSLFLIGLIAGRPFSELLAALIALFMCVVPQGLPVIMTLILVSSAYVMAPDKVVAKRLQAIEALGRAQVAIIDKTGTLTKNELMVRVIVADKTTYQVTGQGYYHEGHILYEGVAVQKGQADNRALLLMMKAAVLLDRSVIEEVGDCKKFLVKGSPNDAALQIAALKYGIRLKDVEKEYKKIHEIPFSSTHQFHAGFYEHRGQGVIFGIGSLESITCRSGFINHLHQAENLRLTQQGTRVMAVGYKTFSLSLIPQDQEEQKKFFAGLFNEGLEQLGLFGIQDTLRKNVTEVIKSIKNAGLQVVMATGDNSETASHLARAGGLLEEGGKVISGTAFSQLSDDDLLVQLSHTAVYARLLPADKVRLVQLFRKQGNIVMVVGDGVNDVPALGSAHIGVTMGLTGSELAKEAAHIILLDDAFEKIVEGIEYGRHTFYTFKRVILYFFATNFAEVLVMLFSLAGGYPVPLLASQILWLNLVTDGFLDTALSLEPVEKDIMRSSWLQEQKYLLTKELMGQVIYMALLGALLSCCAFIGYLPYGIDRARTMTMVILTSCQWITAINCRSLRMSVFSLSFFSNPWLAVALIGIVCTQIALLYVPFLQVIFKTVPLTVTDWCFVIGAVFVLLVAEEIRKGVKRLKARLN